ncbi:MAG: energy-coupling factor transporter transmembrane protein EcfT [Desulfurococcales archaeon]|nr:energy-coupling factor transporter transmembrane protein EcfT [Desulfurococcales archaeon]
MITWIVRRVEAALNYEPRQGLAYEAHAGLKILALAVSWALSLAPGGLPPALAGLLYPLILHALAGRSKAVYAFQSSIIATAFIGVAALVLTPYRPFTWDWLERGLILTARVYALASVSLLTFSTTPPGSLLALTARRLPLVHDILLLSYRLAPQVAGDMATAYAVQGLLGKGLRDPLVGSVLAELYRARMIEVSLYARGVRPGEPRTPMAPPGDVYKGMVLLVLSALGWLLYIPYLFI